MGPKMVTRLTWLVGASANPMGMQTYEAEIQVAVREVAGQEWAFRTLSLASWADKRGSSRRTPERLTRHAVAAPVVGALLVRRGPVHRMDLRLPPTPREVLTVHDVPPLRFDDEGPLPNAT